jgi:ATP/maltotriose-dependent transcriptional regulator MalT
MVASPLDRPLAEAALRDRAEIHALRGEVDLAYHCLDAIRELRGFVPNAIHDAEDLRVVAMVRVAEGNLTAAERVLREVIERAEVYRQPQLQAKATRDLATVLRRAGQHADATVPIDPPAGSKRPCGTEMHIGFPNASLATSAV